MAKSTGSVEFEGVKFDSRTAAAKVLVASGKSIGETAKLLGMTYQTVYANTKGFEKTLARRAKYSQKSKDLRLADRILTLGKSGKVTVGDIAKKAGVNTSKVVAMLKKSGIPLVTKESLSSKEPKVEKTVKSVKVEKSVAKAPKVKVSKKVKDLPKEMILDNVESDNIAAQEAMKDMASE